MAGSRGLNGGGDAAVVPPLFGVKNLCKKNPESKKTCQECKFRVQFDLYKLLEYVSGIIRRTN